MSVFHVFGAIAVTLRELSGSPGELAYDRRGSIAIFFSLSILPLIAVAGAGYDLLAISTLKGQLQAAADAGALRVARELRLARRGGYDPTPIARHAAQAALSRSAQPLSSLNVAAALIDNSSAVQVKVDAVYNPRVLRVVYREPVKLAAKATARTNGFPICALGLAQETSDNATVYLEASARVTAQFCAVHSNAKSPVGITAMNNSKLTAGQICSAGGTHGPKANFQPGPINDCPVLPDPLASRSPPPVGACAHNDEVVDGGTVTLTPGTYCGGLKVGSGAIVTLSPGEYVIKDGPLVVEKNATLIAQSAGVYLTGSNATVRFAAESTIKMTAPVTGPLAGLLFFEDRAAPKERVHKFTSDNAPVLLGTIYLPQGVLVIDANRPIAQQSAFTIVVARKLKLMAGPDLVLNSDYGATSVPVPGGLNPGVSYLTQ